MDFNLKVNDRIEVVVNKRVYKALITDIDDDFLEINAPVCDGEYLILNKGQKIEINSYLDESRCYNFFSEVISRGKESSIIYYKISEPFNLTKIQRRNFFRVNLVKDIEYKIITNVDDEDIDNIDYSTGLMIDLSAGGLRLKIKEQISKLDLVLVNLRLNNLEFELKCEVVRTEITEDKQNLCGLRFMEITAAQAEKIIKELFEVVRKQRANL